MNGGTMPRWLAIAAFRIRPSRIRASRIRASRIRARLMRGALIRGALIRAALLALVGALVLAGCGGSSNAAGTSAATTSASATVSAGLSVFETCLKQHGVTIKPGQFSARPRASFSPGALPTGSLRPRASFAGRNSAAFKACAKYAPAGFGRGFNGVISSSALAAFKSCLTSNGVKVTGSTASAVLAELRNSTGKTAAAVRTCRVLLEPAAPTPTPSPLPGPTAWTAQEPCRGGQEGTEQKSRAGRRAGHVGLGGAGLARRDGRVRSAGLCLRALSGGHGSGRRGR